MGESRRRILDTLVAAFDEVERASESRVAVLVSQPGWGKTRIVQELYGRLAARQSQPAYWPLAIMDEDGADRRETATLSSLSRGRKAVYPTRVDVPAGAEMDWMWWGILCQQRTDGHLVQAMFDDAAQLYAHAQALMRDPIDDVGGRAFDVGAAAIGVLGLLGLAVAPPVGAAIAIAGATREGWKNADVVKRLREWWSSNHGAQTDRVVASDSAVHHEDRVARLIVGLVRLSRVRPLIVVVDDAQFADETLVRVIDGLVREPRSRVMVVATVWPSHLDAPVNPLPFASWARGFAAERPDRFLRFDLDELAADDVEAVVQAELPAAAGFGPQLYGLYGTNLLAIRGVLRLPRVRRIAERGELDLDALAKLPRDVEAMFAEHWAGLPEALQHVLALAAQPHGTRYLPQLVAEAYGTQGLAEAARDRLSEGVSPYAWAREVDASLHSFVEPVLHQIAKGRSDELLLEEEIEALYAAIVDTAERIETVDLSPIARQELLEQHVALVQDGSVAEDLAAARSAYALAELHASRYDFARAIELATLAIAWTSLPLDDLEMLLARHHLVRWLGDAGRVEEASRAVEDLLADYLHVLGPEDPDTLVARGDHAWLLGESGRVHDAVAGFQELLADLQQLGLDDLSCSDPEQPRALAGHGRTRGGGGAAPGGTARRPVARAGSRPRRDAGGAGESRDLAGQQRTGAGGGAALRRATGRPAETAGPRRARHAENPPELRLLVAHAGPRRGGLAPVRGAAGRSAARARP